MIKGTGIDIVEIDRFKRAIERRSRLIDRVFTESEKAYCLERNKPYIHFAMRFAAKEAVAKSLGTGFRNFKLQDIEIIRMSSGKPTVVLHNGAKKIADSMEIGVIDVSMSFSKTNAIANALAFNDTGEVRTSNFELRT